ncbi:hypothetical protein OG311_18510 [Streptomyces sp. NBC_01343]|nr:hypothetical protein OG311_18510 [Streptomyces sp. NBC_01343]
MAARSGRASGPCSKAFGIDAYDEGDAFAARDRPYAVDVVAGGREGDQRAAGRLDLLSGVLEEQLAAAVGVRGVEPDHEGEVAADDGLSVGPGPLAFDVGDFVVVGDEADAGAVAVDDGRLAGYPLLGDLEVVADMGGAVGEDRLLQVRRDLDVLALA